MVNFVKNAARQAMESPNLSKAFVFFLLPFILQLVVLILIGSAFDLTSIAFGGILELVSWFLGAIVLYLLLSLFKGKDFTGKFKGLLVGIGFRYVFVFLFMLLTFIVLFIAVPEFFPLIARFSEAQTGEEAYNLIGENLNSISQKNSLILFSAFGIIILVTVLTLVLIMYLVYQLIALSGPASPRKNLLILLIWVAIQAIISLFI